MKKGAAFPPNNRLESAQSSKNVPEKAAQSGKTRKKGGMSAALLTLPMFVWTLLFVGVTLGYILWLSFQTRTVDGLSTTGVWTLANYQKLLDPIYLRVLFNSLKLAFFTTVISLAVGYPFGYFMARADKKWRGILLLLVIVPFWTNALVRVYGWRILLLPDGPLNSFLMAVGIISKPVSVLNTFGAVLLGMVYALLPFMILPVYSSVEKMDWHLVEAARDMGASRFRAFYTVTLPMTAPGVLAGCVLTFVPSIGLFFMSDLLGGAKEVLLGNLIDKFRAANDMPFAAAVSVVMMLMTVIMLWIYRRAGGKSSDITLF